MESSPAACIGLDVNDETELDTLISSVLPRASLLGEVDGLRVVRWEDQSGARLVLGLADGELKDLLLSFAAPAETWLDNISLVSDKVATADVVDDPDHGFSIALELEERQLISASPPPGPSLASIVAFGYDVAVHRSAQAFHESTRSLLDPNDDPDSEPSADYPQGESWPRRVAHESFLSWGAWSEPPKAFVRLAGTVTSAEVRRNTYTNQRFVAARLTIALAFATTVCFTFADDDECPQPGNIVEGDVVLVGSLGVEPHTDQTSDPSQIRQ
jgi:hypothetical protein